MAVGPDDPLDAGLEIMCMPPGKKLSTLSLLSGGELDKALDGMDLVASDFPEGVNAADLDIDKLQVQEAMSDHVYTVSPDTTLNEAITHMRDHKFGAAVVMKDGKCVGMFTVIDALGVKVSDSPAMTQRSRAVRLCSV